MTQVQLIVYNPLECMFLHNDIVANIMSDYYTCYNNIID